MSTENDDDITLDSKVGKDSAVNGTPNIDADFLRAVKLRDYELAYNLVDRVNDINIYDPASKATALHFAAARKANKLLARLEQREDLNYLVVDAQNRYPSELAWVIADNDEVGLHLMEKEKEYASIHGLDPRPKH